MRPWRRRCAAAPAPARSGSRARAGCASRDAAVMPAAHHARRPRADRQSRACAKVSQRVGIVLGAGEDEIARPGEARRLLEQLGIVALDRARDARVSAAANASGVAIAEEDRERGDAVRVRRAACGSARRRPSAGDARPGAGSGRRRSAPSPRSVIDAAGGGQRGERLAGRARRAAAGMRPPQISCCVWAKNSISRMPPRPSLTSWPATAIRPPPRCASIWRLIEWMSWIAAKSRCLRHRNGRSSARKRCAGVAVAGHRPRLDQRRALPILARRSRNRRAPPSTDIAGGVEPGSGRSRRSVRKT